MESAGVLGLRAREYDQFFTKDEVAAQCICFLQSLLTHSVAGFDVVIEPSFGGGAFKGMCVFT